MRLRSLSTHLRTARADDCHRRLLLRLRLLQTSSSGSNRYRGTSNLTFASIFAPPAASADFTKPMVLKFVIGSCYKCFDCPFAFLAALVYNSLLFKMCVWASQYLEPNALLPAVSLSFPLSRYRLIIEF
ncbi:hypothetical protein TSMEX_005336 [Taenia solium]|eukprot:TsM_000138200 transcript=TsM_000138200 gene=TsM_000138200